MPEDEPIIVARALQYLYTGNYDVTHSPELPGLPATKAVCCEPTDISPDAAPEGTDSRTETPYAIGANDAAAYLEVQVKVYALADKLGLQNLRSMAFNWFRGFFIDKADVLTESQTLSLLRLVYETTPSSDVDLRYNLTVDVFGETLASAKWSESAMGTIKQHEPLMAKLGLAHQSLIARSKSQQEEIKSCTAERDKLQADLALSEASVRILQQEVSETKNSMTKQWRDTRADQDKEMRYVDHALSEMKVARYCGYCGDKDSLTTSRQYNSGSGKKDVKLTCPSCREWRFIDRVEQ